MTENAPVRGPETAAFAGKKLTSKGQRTRSVILDAAERQFAERGFEGVSLRQIMDEAQVQMGQLQYYFPTKEDVFASVLERRLAGVVERYRQAMDEFDQQVERGEGDLSAVIRAVLAVSREWLASDDVGRHRYLRMLGLATMSFSQPDYIQSHGQAFRPLNERVVAGLCRVFPDSDQARVIAAYHFIEAQMLSLYVNLDALFARKGEPRSAAGVHRFYDDLEEFLCGGCARMLGSPSLAI